MKKGDNSSKLLLGDMKKRKKFLLKSQKGIAMLEMLPLLVVFITLFGLTFGFWTAIHSATLSSIAARHYAFSVINNRTHFEYHGTSYYGKNGSNGKTGYRFFAVVDYQKTETPYLIPVSRKINLFDGGDTKIPQYKGEPDKANPIQIKTGYGICFDLLCGRR